MDLQQIRWYQLKKQNLLSATTDATQIFEKNLVLHATDTLTPYFSLWARVQNFQPKTLFDDLNLTQQAIRLRAFRGTLFVTRRTHVADILAASKIYFESQLSQVGKAALRQNIELEKLTRQLHETLSGGQNLTTREFKKLFNGLVPPEHFILLMRFWEFNQNLGRAPERYLLDNVIRYGLLRDLIPEFVPEQHNPENAVKLLLQNYVRQFGPVCLEDICWWFPLKKSLARQLLQNMKPDLIELKLGAQTYFMDKSDFAAFREFEMTPQNAPEVYFLPYEDHFPKAFQVRDWFLSEEVKNLVYEKGTINLGQIRPTIWWNGEIVGRWEIDWQDTAKSAARVVISGIIERAAKKADRIEDQRLRLESFINQQLVPLLKK